MFVYKLSNSIDSETLNEGVMICPDCSAVGECCAGGYWGNLWWGCECGIRVICMPSDFYYLDDDEEPPIKSCHTIESVKFRDLPEKTGISDITEKLHKLQFHRYTDDESLYLLTGHCIDVTHIVQPKARNDNSDNSDDIDYSEAEMEDYLRNKERFDRFKVKQGEWDVYQSGALFIGTCTGCKELKIGDLCCD